MSNEPVNCPHQVTMDAVNENVNKVLASVEKIDVMLRGDGESVGLIARVASVERQNNERADDNRVTRQTVVGGLILAALTSIGAAAFSVFTKHAP